MLGTNRSLCTLLEKGGGLQDGTEVRVVRDASSNLEGFVRNRSMGFQIIYVRICLRLKCCTENINYFRKYNLRIVSVLPQYSANLRGTGRTWYTRASIRTVEILQAFGRVRPSSR